ncbi:hypothetical protein M409DRAFT_70858 [Zasmidium cellare ATCC 36951]|uniref:Uncharacterized protein n=1 Tax=Zasmidium cellare ATCC 36951 TaxID=1080233 RepID=A0A6A6BXY7_ZASCE|nr:uncharacterized protein M409DRAFT_70858 [Zasmidium cellare ATCC 36951]KAF2159674.1 hypothetical protein M409DRAFT_70858 [Zasmidium cellare ATCC 36951]
MSAPSESVIYVLDFNVGNETDDPNNPWTSGRIAVGTPSSNTLKTLKSHELRPDGIEVLLHEGQNDGRIFWTQMGGPEKNDGTVQSSALDGDDVKDIFSRGEIHTPKQLAIDEKNGKLYVCDREGLRVHRSNLDGTQKEVLIQTGTWTNDEHVSDAARWCVGICVDAENGLFYWTQKGPSKGGKGKILRANIKTPKGATASTRNDIEVLFEDLPEPIDLQLSVSTQQLYWTDRGDFSKGNKLNRASVAGSLGRIQERGYEILARHLHEAIGLQVDEKNRHVYVSDLGGDVYRYDLDGKGVEKFFEGQGVFTGIAVADLGREERARLYGL